jgi:hypothetical protein
MPITASIVDWLRAELGQPAADAIVRKGMRGRGGFWAREVGPDGITREFGSRAGSRVGGHHSSKGGGR